MIKTLRRLFTDLTETSAPARRFAENDERLAAAALLVHAATIDGQTAPAERDKLRAVLRERFTLSEPDLDELLAEATEAEHEAVDLYRFTSLLNRSLDEAARVRIVEMMWEIVYADGRAGELEENLLWRAADLLGVSANERIALRQRVAGTRAT